MRSKNLLLVLGFIFLGAANAQDRPSWGITAIGAGIKDSNSRATVYVLDGGVSPHPDLFLSERHGIAANHNTLVSNSPAANGHATHVAGIIGSMRNNTGTLGVLPGVKIVSINMVDNEGSINYEQAFDRTYDLIRQKGSMGIVNLSFNPPQPHRFNMLTFRTRVERLSRPDPQTGYPGAFISMSAGNQGGNACVYAYSPTNDTLLYHPPKPNDGIMVVGALNEALQSVLPGNGVTGGFVNSPPFSPVEPGSNYGPCVEIWAPGNRIESTWPNASYRQASGTSMAAPMVSGIAAYLMENTALKTPGEIEVAIRNYSRNLDANDYSGLPIRMAKMPSTTSSSPNTPPPPTANANQIDLILLIPSILGD